MIPSDILFQVDPITLLSLITVNFFSVLVLCSFFIALIAYLIWRISSYLRVKNIQWEAETSFFYPLPSLNNPEFELQMAHIIRRTIGGFQICCEAYTAKELQKSKNHLLIPMLEKIECSQYSWKKMIESERVNIIQVYKKYVTESSSM